MKKFFYLAVAACAALAACSKNEVTPVDVDQQITFQAVVNKASTKGMIDGTNYKTTYPSFGTAAYYNATGTTFPTSSSPYIPESEVKYSDTALGWTTETPYYWPKNGALTFFSYSPWTTLNTLTTIDETNGVVITGYDVDANQAVDVMVADAVTCSSNDTAYDGEGSGPYKAGVKTVFRHKLAQIVDVKFQSNNNYKHDPIQAGDKQFFINYVKVNNYKQKGTYTSTNSVSSTTLGSWSDIDGAKNYTFFEETTSCDKEFTSTATSANSIINGYLLLLPQSFTASDATEFEIKYTIRSFWGTGASEYSDDVVTVHIPFHQALATALTANTISMNKKYTFTFTVGLDQIYWAPSVENWGTESVNYSLVI